MTAAKTAAPATTPAATTPAATKAKTAAPATTPAATTPAATKAKTAAPATTPAATKATKAKAGGVRRVANKKTADALVSRFTMPISSGGGAALKAAHEVLPQLKKFATLTPFGHKAFDPTGVKAMTAVIDSWLINTVKTGQIDVKALIDSAFNTLTTTSRVVGQPVEKQVIATYKKVIDHLATFCMQKPFDKYLSNRLAAAGYTPVQAKNIFSGFAPLANITRNAVLDGKKAAATYYKNK
jgi:hypothetical protein